MTAARVTILRDGSLVLETPYLEPFVTQLKLEIPSWARRWQPDARVWTVREDYAAAAISSCQTWFAEVIIDDQRPRANPKDQGRRNWAELLFASIPDRLHTPLYRAIAKVLHPDIGGDAAAMKTLTAAYDRRAA